MLLYVYNFSKYGIVFSKCAYIFMHMQTNMHGNFPYMFLFHSLNLYNHGNIIQNNKGYFVAILSSILRFLSKRMASLNLYYNSVCSVCIVPECLSAELSANLF